ncbi:MAG: hypothetical protein K6G61_11160 [Solobacterium sp.]|nr:hypothetical protein [Solobacterium sp.]
MIYISSDTNVWIDFRVINKLELPFRLPYTYLMNKDAVYNELLSPKGLREQLLKLGLIPAELTEDEFYYAVDIAGKYPRLSEYDRSALAIAKTRSLTLLTGDGALRKAAEAEGVTVMGTIGILDQLLKEECVSEAEYQTCIADLLRHNGREVRLPQRELKQRLPVYDDFEDLMWPK